MSLFFGTCHKRERHATARTIVYAACPFAVFRLPKRNDRSKDLTERNQVQWLELDVRNRTVRIDRVEALFSVSE